MSNRVPTLLGEVRSRRPALLLCLTILLALWPLAQGHFFGTGDMRELFIPLETFFQEQQLAGHLPVWNPDIAWGFPVIASAQIGFFYPPLLLLRVLPLWFYISLLFAAHIVAAGLGTYLLARRLGVSRAGSYLAGIAFALSGFLWQHATHLNIVFTAVWLPWQLLVAHWLAGKARWRLHHIALLALTFAWPFWAGHLHVPLLTAAVSAVYVLTLIWKSPERRTRLTYTAIAVVLAVALAAVQLAPTLELARASDRGSGTFSIEQANQHSFPPYHLHTALFPRFFGNDDTYWGKRLEIEYGFFIGVIPLMFALFALRSKTRPRFFVWLAGITFLLALGSLSPVRLLGLEPSLWFFSAPARWLLFTTISGALLAGHGWDAAIKQPKAVRTMSMWIGVAIVAGVLAWNAAIWLLPQNTPEAIYDTIGARAPGLVEGRPAAYYLDKMDQLLTSIRGAGVSLASPFTWVGLVALAALPLLLPRQRRVLLAVAAAELIVIASTTSPTVPWRDLITPPDSIAVLPDSVLGGQARLMSFRHGGDSGFWLTNPDTRADTADRAVDYQLLLPLTNAQWHVPGVVWPASLPIPASEAARAPVSLENPDFFTAAAERNIGTVLVDHKIPGFIEQHTPNFTNENFALYVTDAAPRAELITESEAKAATYEAISPTHTRITTNSKESGTLLVRDTFYPGWEAIVDGTPTPIERADNNFRQLFIPAGEHTIDMRYHPWPIRYGLIGSAIAIAACATLLATSRYTKMHHRHSS